MNKEKLEELLFEVKNRQIVSGEGTMKTIQYTPIDNEIMARILEAILENPPTKE